jgi:outer membrane protein
MKIGILLTVILLLTSNTLHLKAQKSWTLEECISHAMENNLHLKRSLLQVESSQADFTQSAYEMGPNLAGFYNHQYSKGTTFNQYTLRFENIENQGGSLGLSSSLTLFDGLYGFNNRLRLKHQLESKKEDAEIMKNNITLSVVAGFLQVLMDTENLKLASEQHVVSIKHLEKAEVELKLGRISQGDYLTIKSQSINQRALLTSAQNRLAYSTIELTQLLELENPEDFSIKITPITLSNNLDSNGFEELFQEVFPNRPEIRKAKSDYLSAESGLKMAYGLLSPKVYLNYQLGSGYDQSAWYRTPDSIFVQYPDYTYSQQLKDYVQQRISFQISIPLFQRLTYKTSITKSKIQVLDAQIAAEQAERMVYKDVQNAFAQAQAAWDNYKAYSESAESFKELYNQTVSRFELGMVNALDLGVAQNNLVKAEGELLHAKYTYLLRTKILDFYRGIPISL